LASRTFEFTDGAIDSSIAPPHRLFDDDRPLRGMRGDEDAEDFDRITREPVLGDQ
jgi:hypothetical protein